jgi:hypothetical protein
MKMKALTSILLLAVTSLYVQAQPTLNSSDMPQEGAEYYVSSVNPFSGLDFVASGPEYVWFYTSLEPVSQTTRSFISISDAPFTYQFLFNNPFDQEYVADFAENTEGFSVSEQLSFDAFYAFYKNDAEAYKIVGYGATINGIPIPSQTDPIDVIYEFPLEYENTASSYSEWLVSIPELATYKMKQTRSYEVDGWGNLYLPNGIFETLRIKMDYEITDSIYIDALELGFELDREYTEYQWLGLAASVPLLVVTENNGIITNIQYRDQEPIGIDESLDGLSSWNLYPNPTSDALWLNGDWNNNTSYSIYDLTGKEIQNAVLYNQYTRIDISGLTQGLYLIQIKGGTKNNEFLYFEKI